MEHETRFELATPTLAMLSGGLKVLSYSVSEVAGVSWSPKSTSNR